MHFILTNFHFVASDAITYPTNTHPIMNMKAKHNIIQNIVYIFLYKSGPIISFRKLRGCLNY